MIFDGKPIDDISDDEIDQLVREHISERQHLEYKVTLNHQDNSDRLELLRDIVSLAKRRFARLAVQYSKHDIGASKGL